MKNNEILELSIKDLKDKISQEKIYYKKMQMKHVLSNIENPMKIVYSRRMIARLLTELNKRKNNG